MPEAPGSLASVMELDPDFIKVGYSAEFDEDDVIEVGPNSLHPELQTLAH